MLQKLWPKFVIELLRRGEGPDTALSPHWLETYRAVVIPHSTQAKRATHILCFAKLAFFGGVLTGLAKHLTFARDAISGEPSAARVVGKERPWWCQNGTQWAGGHLFECCCAAAGTLGESGARHGQALLVVSRRGA